MSEEECHICGDTEVVYVDIIGCHWCQECYDSDYLASF